MIPAPKAHPPADKPAQVINTKAILEFICGEVARQGWDLATKGGFRRIAWMAQAWSYALKHSGEPFTQERLLDVASLVEQEENAKGFRVVGVRVGNHIAPHAEHVPRLVKQWLVTRDTVSADKFYLGFQDIHPFADGNGRTGKILHNWILGTLADPILIKDYFGGGNP